MIYCEECRTWHANSKGAHIGPYDTNPRDYALQLVEDGIVDADTLLLACLKYMSHFEVRGMLDANELTPCDLEGDNDV